MVPEHGLLIHNDELLSLLPGTVCLNSGISISTAIAECSIFSPESIGDPLQIEHWCFHFSHHWEYQSVFSPQEKVVMAEDIWKEGLGSFSHSYIFRLIRNKCKTSYGKFHLSERQTCLDSFTVWCAMPPMKPKAFFFFACTNFFFKRAKC